MLEQLKTRARALKKEVFAVYLAAKDSRTPWYAKGLVLLIVAYTLSPIDLIPDFIPVLGYLDDLVIVPLGVFLAIKMIPPPIMEECRRKAGEYLEEKKPQFKFMGGIIIAIWVIVVILAGLIIYKAVR